jgi:hypothetical protein
MVNLVKQQETNHILIDYRTPNKLVDPIALLSLYDKIDK